MKKMIRTILLIGIVASLLFSCKDDDSDNIFPDKYVKILSLKETGIKDIQMNTTQQSVSDSILILKGGGRPNSVSNMELKVLSKEEAAAIGGYELDRIQIIPSDSYEIVADQNIKLEENESHKYVPVTFNPSKIYAAMKDHRDVIWILPVALVSSTDVINDTKNKLLMRFDVRSPMVEWNMDTEQNAEIVYETLDVPLSLKVAYSEENTLDFTLDLDASGNDVLVRAYNDSLGTDYKLLPNGAYSFEKFDFNAGNKEAYANLTLSRTGLQSDHTYLLPLKLSVSSISSIDKTDSVKYLVITNPKYVYRNADRSSWKIAFANCQEPWNFPAFTASSIIDGNIASAWASNWNGSLASGDDYDYTFRSGYHALNNQRLIPNMVIVIDMGREVALGGIGFNKSSEEGDQDLKSCEIYLSGSFTFKPYQEGGSIANYNTVNDGNNWGSVALTCVDIPRAQGTFWYNLSDAELNNGAPKGRFLKFRPTASHRGDNLCNLNELYLKELISIDGRPVD